ncbi:MAG: hypothetical protein GY909_07580 [Oligoflexia bacterium]|nr:hypothetical protein [Oligoflexia bacterium]
MVSKRKIDQIGDKLKVNEALTKPELVDLLEWRNSFSTTLDYYYLKLKNKIKQDKVKLIARRLKRIESIKIKLKRFKTMRLSTFQDIAGLRMVLETSNELESAYTTLRGLSTKHVLKKLDDYHSKPKQDGYRGIHLVYQTGDSSLIEIQLRTELEHIWATAVETYGELQSTSFKTGDGEKDWKEFFKLLSSYFAIKEKCLPTEDHVKLSDSQIKSRLKKYIDSLKVIERLNAATVGMETIVVKQNEHGRMGRYALVELDVKNKTTKIDVYNKKDIEIAIKAYTEKELSEDKTKNYVFVNMENLEKIKESYPNYFLNTQKLLEILSKIVLNQF